MLASALEICIYPCIEAQGGWGGGCTKKFSVHFWGVHENMTIT